MGEGLRALTSHRFAMGPSSPASGRGVALRLGLGPTPLPPGEEGPAPSGVGGEGLLFQAEGVGEEAGEGVFCFGVFVGEAKDFE